MKASIQIIILFVAAALAAPAPNPDRLVTGSPENCNPNYKRTELEERACRAKYSEYENLGASQ